MDVSSQYFGEYSAHGVNDASNGVSDGNYVRFRVRMNPCHAKHNDLLGTRPRQPCLLTSRFRDNRRAFFILMNDRNRPEAEFLSLLTIA
jgi:hypothetical protein